MSVKWQIPTPSEEMVNDTLPESVENPTSKELGEFFFSHLPDNLFAEAAEYELEAKRCDSSITYCFARCGDNRFRLKSITYNPKKV